MADEKPDLHMPAVLAGLDQQPEPQPTPEPEPEAQPSPEPEATPEPEPDPENAEPENTPEPEPEPESEPTVVEETITEADAALNPALRNYIGKNFSQMKGQFAHLVSKYGQLLTENQQLKSTPKREKEEPENPTPNLLDDPQGFREALLRDVRNIVREENAPMAQHNARAEQEVVNRAVVTALQQTTGDKTLDTNGVNALYNEYAESMGGNVNLMDAQTYVQTLTLYYKARQADALRAKAEKDQRSKVNQGIRTALKNQPKEVTPAAPHTVERDKPQSDMPSRWLALDDDPQVQATAAMLKRAKEGAIR